MFPKFFASLIVVLVIVACAPTAPELMPSPTSPPSTPAPLDQKVDVGGYRLRIICTGEGTPTVVVDAAFGEPALEQGNWLKVRYGVEKTTRICMYDRAGLGSSESAPTQHRTSQDMVKDLHTLLVNASVPGPYVLVGQEVGGLNAVLYASQYPEEVDGIVLVDSLHPDYHTETLAVLPTETPGESQIWKGRRSLFTEFVFETPESLDLRTSADQVRGVGSLGDLPLVVLTSRSAFFTFPNLPPDVAANMEKVWNDLQVDLAGLSSSSTHIIAAPGSQGTPVDVDQQIIDAILNVVARAKR